MPYRYTLLRGTRVLARCDANGLLIADSGRVEIRYNSKATKAYRAGLSNLEIIEDEPVLPDDTCLAADEPSSSAGQSRKKSKPQTNVPSATVPEGALIAYTDGACSGNPGPSGVGVVLLDGGDRREYSGFLGDGTNNIAELTAILVVAEAVTDPTRPVRIYTDSTYSIGVLSKGWKAKANVSLIANTKKALSRLRDVGFVHVRGHAGIPENERADELAVVAVADRATAGWTQ